MDLLRRAAENAQALGGSADKSLERGKKPAKTDTPKPDKANKDNAGKEAKLQDKSEKDKKKKRTRRGKGSKDSRQSVERKERVEDKSDKPPSPVEDAKVDEAPAASAVLAKELADARAAQLAVQIRLNDLNLELLKIKEEKGQLVTTYGDLEAERNLLRADLLITKERKELATRAIEEHLSAKTKVEAALQEAYAKIADFEAVRAYEQERARLVAEEQSRTPVGIAADHWYDQLPIPCYKSEYAVMQTLTSLKLTVKEAGNVNPNPHYLLALYRRAATAKAFAKAVSDGHTEIDVLYYNNRDVGIASGLTEFIKDKCGVTVKFNMVGKQIVAADVTRRFSAIADRSPTATAAVAIDVYYMAEDSNEGVTLAGIEAMHYQNTYWVLHPFHGAMGNVQNAVWFRDDDGMIHWSSDSVNGWCAPHPACDVLHRPHANGRIAIAIVDKLCLGKTSDKVGEVVYDIIKSSRSSIVDNNVPQPETTFKWVETEVPDYAAVPDAVLRLPRLLRVLIPIPRKKMLLHEGHVMALRAKVGGQGLTFWTYANLANEASNVLRADKDYIILVKRLGLRLQSYQRDLILHTFYTYAREDNVSLIGYRDMYGVYAEDKTTERTHVGQAPSDVFTTKHMLIASLVAVIGAYLYGRNKRVAVAAAFSTKFAKLLQTVSSTWQSGKQRLVNQLPQNKIRAKAHSMVDRICNIPGNLFGYSQILSQFVIKITAACTGLGFKSFDYFADYLARTACAMAGISLDRDYWTKMKVMFLSPIIEELFKKIPYGSQFATSLIALADMNNYANPGVEYLAWHASLHFLLASMPLSLSIPLHSMYNILTLIYGAHNGQGRFAPLSAFTQWEQALNDPETSSYLYVRREQDPVTDSVYVRVPSCKEDAEFADTPHFPRQAPSFAAQTVNEHDSWYYGMQKPHRFNYPEGFFSTVNVDTFSYVPPAICCPSIFPRLDPRLKVVGDFTKFGSSNAACFFTLDEHNRPVYGDKQQGYFRAIIFNGPMYQPARVGINAAWMAICRLLADVPKPQDGMWDVAYALMRHSGYATTVCACEACESSMDMCFFDGDAAKVLSHDIRPLNLDDIYAAPGERSWITHKASHIENYLHMDREARFRLWMKHVGSKAPLYESAYQATKQCPLTTTSKVVTTTQVNIKTDEVLLKIREEGYEDDTNGFIPRPIHAVDPQVTVTLGPSVHEATRLVKKIFHANCLGRADKYVIKVRFAAGATQEDLSEWFNEALHGARHPEHPVVTIFVAGDDSTVVTPWGIFTGDLSKCDRTISPPAVLAECAILRDLGVDPEDIDLLAATLRSQLRISVAGDDTVVFIKRIGERNTGGVDTTFGNSICVIMAYHLALFTMVHDITLTCEPVSLDAMTKHVQDVFEQLGLILKLRITPLPEGKYTDQPPEFLKGWWLLNTSGTFTWTFLPSRFMKITKTVHDPRKTMRTVTERKNKTKLSLKEALSRFLTGIALSHEPFAQPSITRKIFKAWMALSHSNMSWQEDVNPIHITPSRQVAEPTDTYFLNACVSRYGGTLEIWSDFWFLLTRAKAGMVLFGPTWDWLAQDYA